MSYCVNPACPEPQNDSELQCRACGSDLLLHDRYRPLQLLGQGGFGRTFLAIDTESKPTQTSPPIYCVLKQLWLQNPVFGTRDRAINQIRQEVQRLEELGKHPQIPTLMTSFEQDGSFYLVQEFIQGKTLAAELEQQGAFDEAQIWQLLNQLLPVLKFIHGNRVVHRDIKPENIIRRLDGHLVLVDFGAAKTIAQGAIPQSGTRIGSPEYVAPEQARGKVVYASDLYSLGVTCIHLLTQVPPFDLFDVTSNEWVWQQYLPKQISPSLSQILDKLIQNALNYRFQSAAEVIEAIAASTVSSSNSIEDSVLKTPSSSFYAEASYIHPTSSLSLHSASVNAVAISPDGQILASVSDDKTIKLWNLKLEQLASGLVGHTSCVKAIAFSPEGQILASASDDKTIKLWDWETGKILSTLRGHRSAVTSVHFSSDGEFLVSGSWDKTIKLWHVKTGTEAYTLVGHGLQITAIALSPDGRTLASASFDRSVRLWSLPNLSLNPTLQPFFTLCSHARAVQSIAFSPDGTLLASGSDDNTIKVWQVATGQLLQTLTGHSWSVSSIAFSPDGKILISASWDKTIKLWRVNSDHLITPLSDEIGTLVGHSDSVNSVAVSSAAMDYISQINDQAAGRAAPFSRLFDFLIVSGSRDRTIALWYP